jgi:hypothetical protein
MNPLTIHLTSLLDKLAELAYLSTIFEKVQSHAEQSATRLLEHFREKANDTYFVAMTSLRLPNLFTTIPTQGPYGGHLDHGDRLRSVIDEAAQRNQSQCLAMAHEMFEGYLRGIAPKLLLVKPEHASNKAKFDSKRKPTDPKEDTLEYWQEYVRLEYGRNGIKFLTGIAAKVPALHDKLTNNWMELNLLEFSLAISVCRNVIAHAGEFDQNATDKIPGSQRAYVQSLMRQSILLEKDILLPSERQIDDLLWKIAGIAYATYRILSGHCGMPLEFEPHRDKGTEKWSLPRDKK